MSETAHLVHAAEGVDFPDVVALTGYLGGTISGPPPGRTGDWRILYLDSQLQNWLLIPDEDIFVFSRVWNEDAAFNLRDVIWVDRDALTTSGGAPPRPEAQARTFAATAPVRVISWSRASAVDRHLIPRPASSARSRRGAAPLLCGRRGAAERHHCAEARNRRFSPRRERPRGAGARERAQLRHAAADVAP